MAKENPLSVLEQMNELLADKEAMYAKREAAIEAKLEELKAFEAAIIEKAEKLVEEKAAFEKMAEETTARLQKEQMEIDARWDVLRESEKNAQSSMDYILQEKLKLQKEENEQLKETARLEVEEMDVIDSSTKLSALAGALGITSNKSVPNFGTSKLRKEGNLLDDFEKAAKKVFPRAIVREHTEERFCISVSGLELRIFDKEDPEIHIVTIKKDEKQGIKNTVQLNRIQTLWRFAYEENHFVGKMFLKEEQSAEEILKQCKKAIEEYF